MYADVVIKKTSKSKEIIAPRPALEIYLVMAKQCIPAASVMLQQGFHSMSFAAKLVARNPSLSDSPGHQNAPRKKNNKPKKISKLQIQ